MLCFVMADSLPDEIIQNILARLPTKTLLRCRCVSTYWNRLLSEPNFMKLRSRRTIIFSLGQTFLHIDDATPNSILNRPYPLEDLRRQCGFPRVIGTFNGIVFLAYSRTLILYNPFTRASKKLPDAPGKHENFYGYGFGYGATPNDLKIVMFGLHSAICNVFSFQNSSWSTSQFNSNSLPFEHDVGKFLNGFLYWVRFRMDQLIVLDLKDMEFSMMHLPFKSVVGIPILGTVDGCLCLLNEINEGFDVWVMKKHGVENLWSIKCSLNLPSDSTLNTCCHPLCILDSGRILLVNISRQPVIYDMTNGSYKTFNIFLNRTVFVLEANGLEYVESLFAPSDMCRSLGLEYNSLKRKRKT